MRWTTYKLFNFQRNSAKRRGIAWHLTYEDWLRFWQDSGHWHERGCGKGKYVMSRLGDKGPYALGNVSIILHEDNAREGQVGKRKPWLKRNQNAQGNKARLGKPHSEESLCKMREARRAWWAARRGEL